MRLGVWYVPLLTKLYLQPLGEGDVCKLYYWPARIFSTASPRCSSFDLSLGSLTWLTSDYGMLCQDDVDPGEFLLIRCTCHFLSDCLVGNSNFWFRFLGPPLEAEFWFCFWFWIFHFFWIPLLKSHQIGIPIPKYGIPNFVLRRNSIHLILLETLIAIAQPVDLMIFNHMDVGTIPGKDILSPN